MELRRAPGWFALALLVGSFTLSTGARAQLISQPHAPAPWTTPWSAPQPVPSAGSWWSRDGADDIDQADNLGQETRLKTAAGMTGVSLGVMSAGLVTFIVSQTATSTCGVTGCFTYPNRRLELAAGALTVAGGGMALVAVPTLLDAMFVKRGAPRRAGRMGWGLALTSLGVGSATAVGYMALVLEHADYGASIVLRDGGSLETRVRSDDIVIPLIAQSLMAATYLGVGIPLWAGGGRSRVAPEPSMAHSGVAIELVPMAGGAAVAGTF